MRLKENKGISLIVFTIILVVLLVVAGGVIVYLLNNPVKEGTAIQTPTELQNNMANNEVEIYTETDKKDIKATIENYYKLLTAKENSPVLMLTDVMKMTVYAVQDPEYAPDNYIEHPNASKYMWTGIKYEDFRNNLWYISDNLLKDNFTEFVEYKDYLYIENNDNNAYDFKYEITKQEINQSSTTDTCICDVTVKNSKTGKTTDSKITMSRGNGDFVITTVISSGLQNNQQNSEVNDVKNENANVSKTDIYTETDKKDIKATIENYYKLLTAKENSPVLMLTDVMKMTVYAVQDPEYAPDNYIEHPNASKYMWTGIKYEDFRNNLWYISDNILKGKFSEFIEYKNYLYIENNDNNSYDFKYEITKQETNQSSTTDTCICYVTVKNSKTGKTLKNKITMSRGNGDFVITKVD